MSHIEAQQNCHDLLLLIIIIIIWYASNYYRDTPEVRASAFIRSPSYAEKCMYRIELKIIKFFSQANFQLSLGCPEWRGPACSSSG